MVFVFSRSTSCELNDEWPNSGFERPIALHSWLSLGSCSVHRFERSNIDQPVDHHDLFITPSEIQSLQADKRRADEEQAREVWLFMPLASGCRCGVDGCCLEQRDNRGGRCSS